VTSMAEVDPQEPATGNPAVERAAIRFVIECERKQGVSQQTRAAADWEAQAMSKAAASAITGLRSQGFQQWALRAFLPILTARASR